MYGIIYTSNEIFCYSTFKKGYKMKKLVLGLILLVLVLVKVNFITKTEATLILSTSSKIEDVEEIYIKDEEEFNAREVDDNNSSSNTLNSIIRGEELNSSSKSNIEEDEEDLNSSSNMEEKEFNSNIEEDDYCEESYFIPEGDELCVIRDEGHVELLPSDINTVVTKKATIKEKVNEMLSEESVDRHVCGEVLLADNMITTNHSHQYDFYKVYVCNDAEVKIGDIVLRSGGIDSDGNEHVIISDYYEYEKGYSEFSRNFQEISLFQGKEVQVSRLVVVQEIVLQEIIVDNKKYYTGAFFESEIFDEKEIQAFIKKDNKDNLTLKERTLLEDYWLK